MAPAEPKNVFLKAVTKMFLRNLRKLEPKNIFKLWSVNSGRQNSTSQHGTQSTENENPTAPTIDKG